MTVLATAGHVDHGKSSLVLALTGTDPDRWAEEKRRGMTIDLGFAHTVLPSGAVASFIDVPGHIRFLRNMLAGVGAIDGCIFVVDAKEGWMPQTEEHFQIAECSVGKTSGARYQIYPPGSTGTEKHGHRHRAPSRRAGRGPPVSSISHHSG